MKAIIIENTWLTRGIIDFGWGNGYVLIPEGHPLHGKNYDEIDVDVHGGLTYSVLMDAEMIEEFGLSSEDEYKWCIGFSTCHSGDSLTKWPKEKVWQETERLKEQILAMDFYERKSDLNLKQLLEQRNDLLQALEDLISYLGEDWESDPQVMEAKQAIQKATQP